MVIEGLQSVTGICQRSSCSDS